MGLLVAGITGGASLIDNARLTSFKREIDDHIRDVFTFYARVGRLPGDLDNTGRIGYQSGGSVSTASSYASPYNVADITITSGPFVELYLYGISSFQPTPPPATIITTTLTHVNVKTIAEGGGIPFSKVHKNFMYVHRYEVNESSNSSSYTFGVKDRTAIHAFGTVNLLEKNKKNVDIIKKMDTKFDDGAHNGGNIRAYCGDGSGTANIGLIPYSTAGMCSEIISYFDVK
jgi:hypothetical protein